MFFMKKILFPALLVILPSLGLMAADQLTVTAINKLPIARASQTIELTAAQLAPLGDASLEKIHVKDAAGRELLCQAVDTDYDDYHRPDIIIFQSDFAPGGTNTFTVTAGSRQKFTPQDYKAYGRFVRERFDDFAWENDLIAHRTFGKALETWKGEPLTGSGIDIWSKLHPTLIINEWYMMGDAYYHHMNSNGGDDYTSGSTRGDGGNGLWAADKMWVSKNFVMSRELANGPIRVMFELDYDAFDVNGMQVAETTRISLDAGSQMDHYQVTFKPAENRSEPLTAVVGLKKVKGEQAEFNAARGTLAIWEPMERNQGMQGVAAIINPNSFIQQADDRADNLLIVKTAPDNSINYWAGFAWDQAGKITTADEWKKYVDEFAQGVQSPIEVSISAGQ
jgi:pectinesterase